MVRDRTALSHGTRSSLLASRRLRRLAGQSPTGSKPPACKAGALPAELQPQKLETVDPLAPRMRSIRKAKGRRARLRAPSGARPEGPTGVRTNNGGPG